MRIDAVKFAFATAIVFAIAWVVCSLFVLSFPVGMMQMSGHMVHADFTGMGWQLNFAGFMYGLFLWAIGAGIFAGAIAAVYNHLIA